MICDLIDVHVDVDDNSNLSSCFVFVLPPSEVGRDAGAAPPLPHRLVPPLVLEDAGALLDRRLEPRLQLQFRRGLVRTS